MMWKWRQRFIPRTIKMQFLLSAGIVSMIPLVFVVFFTYTQYSQVTRNKVMETTAGMLSVIDWNMGQIISEIESVANIVVGSDVIRTSLKNEPGRWTSGERLEMRNEAQKLLINLVNNKAYIDKIFIGNEATGFTQRSSWELNDTETTYDQFARWEKQMRQAEGAGLWVRPDAAQSKNGQLLYYFRLLKDINTLEEIGMLAISIHRSVFDQMLEKTSENATGDIVLFGDGQILYRKSFANNELAEEAIVQALAREDVQPEGQIGIANKQYFMRQIVSHYTDWKIVSLTLYSDFMKDNTAIRDMTFKLMLLAFVAVALIAVIVANGVTGKLKKLMKAIRNWERSRGFAGIHFDGEGEIDKIGSEFIRIADENETLNYKLYASRIKEKEAELLALQSQINPHFLYNTLNAIFWMAQNVKSDKIANTVVALSRFFQLSLNNGDKLTTLANEIEQVNHYMDIQNARYDNRFRALIDIPDALLNLPILKLLIQPLVENAICHGLEMKEGAGTIGIIAYEEQDDIYIKVVDDGIGFDVAAVRSRQGYALKNIDERIKLYYGEAYGVRIESVIGTGTEVTLKLDKRKAQDRDGGLADV